jgi:LmbE family N-acetylglucosaminyl deacetylase
LALRSVVVRGVGAVRRAILRSRPGERDRMLAAGRWLVLAPHPDDETLGAGALLCALADAGRPAQVVYLTDGSASHPGSPTWSRGRLAGLRRREARAALRRLCGVGAPEPVFLDWPDAAPPAPDSSLFAATALRLARLIQSEQITNLATTWPLEPHCDHAAAAALGQAVARRQRGRVRLYWCVVWGWTIPESRQLERTAALPILSPAAMTRRRRAALAQHRSQLGGVVSDSPGGFRLPPAMKRTVADVQVLFRSTEA